MKFRFILFNTICAVVLAASSTALAGEVVIISSIQATDSARSLEGRIIGNVDNIDGTLVVTDLRFEYNGRILGRRLNIQSGQALLNKICASLTGNNVLSTYLGGDTLAFGRSEDLVVLKDDQLSIVNSPSGHLTAMACGQISPEVQRMAEQAASTGG